MSIKQIYNTPNREMAMKIAEIIIDVYKTTYPRVSKLLTNSLDETLTFYDFPEHHRLKIRTTNLIEHLNSQIKRRAKVVNIFPNAESCIRYISAILQEIDEDWQTERKYISVIEEKEKNHQIRDEIAENIKSLNLQYNNQIQASVDEMPILQKI